MFAKISPNLAARVQKLDASEALDVVVELSSPTKETQQAQSRQQKITALKESFNQNTQPLEQLIQQLGGTVIGRGWLNGTLLAQILPAA